MEDEYFIVTLSLREIWDKFYEFENNIGDLTSLLKVEKRRYETLEEILPEVRIIYLLGLCINYNLENEGERSYCCHRQIQISRSVSVSGE